jgi:DNA-binding response OmpR family regulator
LIVCDTGIREPSYADLCAQVHQRCPALPFLFVFDIREDEDRLPRSPDVRTAFLAKPFSSDELAGTVKWLLGRARAATR